MKPLSVQKMNFIAFLVCFALLLFALYLEIHMKLEPCPLCILQRVLIMLLGVLFLIGALLDFQYTSRRVYYFIIFLVAFLGVIIAARHVWLELSPPVEAAACGAGITYLFQMLPMTEALKLVFLGTGECAKISWRFLGLSIPAWTLLWFIIFALFSFWQGFKKNDY